MPSVLITGASTGIGAATTKALARRGWRVFATMRNLEKLAPLERSLKEAGLRDQVEFERIDVTEPASMRDALAAILPRTGHTLDAVVHNAGVATGGAFEDLPPEEIRRVMETNFFGVLELTRQLLPTFRAQRRGRIVIVSSEAAFAGQPAVSMYCASKWALEGWAESLSYELEPFGLHLILIEPGMYRTQIWESSPRLIPADSAYRAWAEHASEAVDALVAKTARDPREVGDVIAAALEARRPRFRYPVGPVARLSHFLHGTLPSRLRRRGLSWYLGLSRFDPQRNSH
jgi:NAD(P)-dependent dehydrogenase (short-subunit alcohol dehydrogenase family)